MLILVWVIFLGSDSLAAWTRIPSDLSGIDPESKGHYENIIKRYETDPASIHKSDFNVLFFPDNWRKVDSSYHIACKASYLNGLTPECTPDTLYSWGPIQKIENLQKRLNAEEWAPKTERRIWATIAPVSTFCYGTHAVRFKIKANSYSEDVWNIKKKVGFYKGTLMDFWFTSSDPIHSWSHDTPEHFDELVKEIQYWNQTSDPKLKLGYAVGDWKSMNIEDSCVPERYPSTEAILVRNLVTMVKNILAGKGEVFFQADAGSSNRTEIVEHFSTSKPTYFNED